MPIVAITDYTFPSLDIETAILQGAGFEVRSGPCKTPEALISLVADADAVITQFAPITPEVIAAMKKALVIVRYGVGVDNVNLEAARSHGIPVCNVPTFCIDEVADHTLGLILAATRSLLPNANLVRSEKWGLAVPLAEMRTLRDLTVGIIGFGRIGAAVAARLAPFKCKRLAFDPATPVSAIESAGCQPATVETLLAESDVVTLHCPSTPETRNLLNSQSIAKMKPGAIVINVARGDVIETAALISALQSGQIAAAALDVCNPEPIPLDSPLRTLPNVVVTSHIASASVTAVRTLRETAAQIAATALRGEPLPNIVNGL
jgi:D-3-phosphoglycerate dehydrogenase / 2-oxoglutarate reductase